jgi:gluconate 2-dehydrogenase gamma chain
MAADHATDVLRRRLLIAAAGSLGGTFLGLGWPEIAAAAEHAHALASAPEKKLAFLSDPEARDVIAIAAQVVPSGPTPGATEAGVVYFIDHVLTHSFADRAPSFRSELAAFAADFQQGRPEGARFADATHDEQLVYLHSIENTPFFSGMRMLTIIGLLADPAYGGNRDKLGWKLVGFDDRHVWEPPFGHYDREYEGFKPYGQ